MLWNVFLGTPKEPGILPRVLDATFHHIRGRRYDGMDLKPYLRNDAQYLDPDQVKQERSAKAAIFASVKDVRDLYPTSGLAKPQPSKTIMVLHISLLPSRNVIPSEPQSPCPVPALVSHPPLCPTIKPVTLTDSTHFIYADYMLSCILKTWNCPSVHSLVEVIKMSQCKAPL